MKLHGRPLYGNDRFLAEKKSQYPCGRYELRDDGRKSCAFDPEVKTEDEDRVKDDVDDRTGHDSDHRCLWESLSRDIEIKTRCEHGEDRTDKVDLQILGRIVI